MSPASRAAGYLPEGGLMVKYEAAWSATDGEVVVIRSIYAGISGPAGEYPAATLADAEAALHRAGYLITDTWGEPRYDGASVWTTLAAI